MRPILCVIDLTQASAQVLEVAARMASAYKSQMTILFPYRLINNGYNGEMSKLKAKLEQEAKEKFLSLKNDVALLDRIPYDFQPEIGFAADRINSFLNRNKVDLVVIGQHQANSMNEVNHTALQTLIAGSKLPFTIVPDEIDVKVFSH
jgi:nucleotide-binding universal stress UspA family protein